MGIILKARKVLKKNVPITAILFIGDLLSNILFENLGNASDNTYYITHQIVIIITFSSYYLKYVLFC